jgi:hypothetical protein
LKRHHHFVVLNEITNNHQYFLCRHIHLLLLIETFRPPYFTRMICRSSGNVGSEGETLWK